MEATVQTFLSMNDSENSTIDNITGLHLGATHDCKLYNLLYFALFFGATCIFGIAGNTLAQLIFWSTVRTNGTAFVLVCLATIDNTILVLQFMLSCIPAWCIFLDDRENAYMRLINPVANAIGWPLVSVAQKASVWTIVLLMFYRYMAVCHPSKLNSLNSMKKLRISMAVIVAVSFVYNIPKFAVNIISYDATNNKLKVSRHSYRLSKAYFVYNIPIYYTIIYVIPFIILITTTTLLLKELHKLSKEKESKLSLSKKDENEVTITLISVVVIFMVCKMAEPVRRVAVTLLADHSCGSTYFYLKSVTRWLVVLNSAVNFILYSLCGRRFRKQVRQRFCCPKEVDFKTTMTANTKV